MWPAAGRREADEGRRGGQERPEDAQAEAYLAPIASFQRTMSA